MAFDRLIKRIQETGNPSVAGLDPKLDYVPAFIRTEVTDILNNLITNALPSL